MRTLFLGIGLIATALCSVPHAHAHQATERFVPIGQSPGLSHKYTYIGEIKRVNARMRTITVAEPPGSRTIKISDKTRIWLDRSKLKLANQVGSFADLQRGRRVEIKYQDHRRKGTAAWVKVEVTAP